MKQKYIKKTICILLSLAFILSVPLGSVYADETTTQPTTSVSQEEAQKTLENQRKDLEAKLAESEKKLSSYSASQKTTEEYIDVLDEKIGYLNEELTLLDNEVTQSQAKVETLQKQMAPLKKQLENLQKEYDDAAKEFNKLNDDFETTYNAYCLRLRAMYISGNSSVLAALLTSSDISQFLSRYEMIKAVSESDTALLKEVNSKMEKILTKKDGLNERKTALEKTKSKYDKKQKEYESEQKSIETKQEEMAAKKITLSEERAESDALLAEYTAQTEMYTEYRNEDEALISSVDSEIDALLNGLKSPDQVTTADESSVSKKKSSSSGSTTGTLFSGSNAVLSMTYPAPGHYTVSCPFGHYSNGKAHTGTDFPCPVGSKIVAAQKGIVIKVKRLTYSYGYYVMIYHGTDAKGRKIVTLYAHNSSINVSVGQTVKKGQKIASSGSTGNSTGPHCHFEVIINGTKTNAKYYLG